ncbi:MAG: metal ABC transporter permease [Spirochaetales bacterium]|nr:metal ABC transporter permease [Spirochaetales bacterium]
MVEWIMEPLGYSFFLRGLFAGLAVSVACGMLSGFIVWRGMAFLGDALAHAILPGIVVSVMFGFSMFLGAMGAAVVSVVAIGAITGQRGFKDDTAIGVIFTGAFALGIVLMNRVSTFKDLSHILFGSILGVGTGDVTAIAAVALIVVIMVSLFYKELLVTSFDPTHAIAIGLSPTVIQYGLLFLVAATTVISVQTVGVVLVLALLVTPAAAASLLSKNLPVIIVMSIGFAAFSVLAGFYASYYLDLASGAAIVLTLTLVFSAVFAMAKVKAGLLRKQ